MIKGILQQLVGQTSNHNKACAKIYLNHNGSGMLQYANIMDTMVIKYKHQVHR
jgi:hypothetical protein